MHWLSISVQFVNITFKPRIAANTEKRFPIFPTVYHSLQTLITQRFSLRPKGWSRSSVAKFYIYTVKELAKF